MAYCNPAELRSLWRLCGLLDVDNGEIVVEASCDDFDDALAPIPSGLAPSGAYCASPDSARQETLRERFFRRLAARPGPFTRTARAWYVRGRVGRPAAA